MDFVDMLDSPGDLCVAWWSVTEKLSEKSRTAKPPIESVTAERSIFSRPDHIILRP
jgi:hypothetical protein